MNRPLFAFVCLVLFMLFSGRADAEKVHISAAASLMEAMKQIAADYERDHADTTLILNFASSGALARQINAGAPVDLYISANPKWMGHLQKQGLIPLGSERTLIRNQLVFVGRTANVRSLEDLPRMQRIALGSPKSTPVGRYTEQALTQAGIYTELQTTQKLILAKDVRQALLYADRGETDGAFVYQTDALLAQQATVLFTVPQQLYPRVVYPAALTSSGLKNEQARHFLDRLFQPTAQDVFKQYGFILPKE